MTNFARSESLLLILRIGHDVSFRGEGISLRDAMRRANYADIRPSIWIDELVAIIHNNPNLIREWTLYCEDKRTSGGWVLCAEANQIWLNSNPSTVQSFDSLEEAVANYALAELDFWAGIAGD